VWSRLINALIGKVKRYFTSPVTRLIGPLNWIAIPEGSSSAYTYLESDHGPNLYFAFRCFTN
jgi:hypothetical protein